MCPEFYDLGLNYLKPALKAIACLAKDSLLIIIIFYEVAAKLCRSD